MYAVCAQCKCETSHFFTLSLYDTIDFVDVGETLAENSMQGRLCHGAAVHTLCPECIKNGGPVLEALINTYEDLGR